MGFNCQSWTLIYWCLNHWTWRSMIYLCLLILLYYSNTYFSYSDPILFLIGFPKFHIPRQLLFCILTFTPHCVSMLCGMFVRLLNKIYLFDIQEIRIDLWRLMCLHIWNSKPFLRSSYLLWKTLYFKSLRLILAINFPSRFITGFKMFKFLLLFYQRSLCWLIFLRFLSSESFLISPFALLKLLKSPIICLWYVQDLSFS